MNFFFLHKPELHSSAGSHSDHLGNQNRTILAILTLYVPPMPPIRFRLNLTNGLGGDIV